MKLTIFLALQASQVDNPLRQANARVDVFVTDVVSESAFAVE